MIYQQEYIVLCNHMMASRAKPHIPFPTGAGKGDFHLQETENLDGLQWGKSGQEMDRERKEQV